MRRSLRISLVGKCSSLMSILRIKVNGIQGHCVKFGGQESVVNCTELKLAQFTWTLIISKFSEFSSLACLFNYMVRRHAISAHAVKSAILLLQDMCINLC